MTNQILIMEEMVQRSEANLQQMKALLAEAREDQTNKPLLDNDLIHSIADKISEVLYKDVLPEDMVELDTRVSGMEIRVELEWDSDQFQDIVYKEVTSILKAIKNEN
jgi:hypothetical protein